MQAIMSRPRETMIGMDFDGTLAPIIEDPEHAYADSAAVAALAELGPLVGSIVVITGRPARTAVRLGRFAGRPGSGDDGGARSVRGRTLGCGQRGVLRAAGSRGDHPGGGGVAVGAGRLGLERVRIEHKGRAIGIHTRELDDPAGAFDRLLSPLTALAQRHSLQIEPGKNVLEIRGHGIDKGDALRQIVSEKAARQVIFAGDDLGDLPAFRAVEQLRTEGIEGLLVCSASHEEDALTAMSDLILDGPPGVAEWLTRLAQSLSRVAPERSA